MNKTKWIRLFSLFSVLLGITMLLVTSAYVRSFTQITLNAQGTAGLFYGQLDKTLFNTSFVIYGEQLTVFNSILIWGAGLFLINLVFTLAIGNLERMKDKVVKDTVGINFITSLFVFLGSILFVFLLPDVINGEIKNYIIFLIMPEVSDQSAYVINLVYPALGFYVVYNAAVLLKTMPENSKSFDEEMYSQEFYTKLQQDEEEDLDDLDD